MKFVYFLVALIGLLTFSSVRALVDPKCKNFCELNYSPVCGTNDEGQTRTFSNLCVLQSENCLQNSNFQKTSDGPCP